MTQAISNNELEKPGDSRTEYRISSCGCKSRYCDRCSVPMGLKIKGKLLAAVSQWKHVYMVTLTYDPTLFPEGQEAAYRYIRKERCVSRFIRALRKRGFLDERHYFCVTEFQKSGNVHFHLLLDAKFIDWNTMVDVWGSFRPAWAGPVENGRPAFGTVDFRIRRKISPAHAANYVAKYLTKPPSDGWPEWVLNFRGRIPRYTASQGFWKRYGLASTKEGNASEDDCEGDEPESSSGFDCDVTCFCEVCRGEAPDDGQRVQSSIRERLATCGVAAFVVRITETMGANGEVWRSVTHLGEVEGGWKAAKDWCDLMGIEELESEGVDAEREFLLTKHYARVPARLAYYAAGCSDSFQHFENEVRSRNRLQFWIRGLEVKPGQPVGVSSGVFCQQFAGR